VNTLNHNFSVSSVSYESTTRIKQQTDTHKWQPGDEVTAELSGINDGVAIIKFNEDFSINVPSEKIKGSVGDTLTFRVKKTRDGFSLTQINIPTTEREQAERGNIDMTKLASINVERTASTDTQRYEEQAETREKTAAAVARIRRAQAYMTDTASPSVIAALLDCGISLSKVDFSSFDRILHEVKKDNTAKINRDEYDEAMKRRYSNRSDAPEIIESLHKHGIAVTDRNIARLESTWQRLPRTVSAYASERLIADDAPLTVDELYKAEHSGAAPADAYADVTEAPPAEIERLFEREGIKLNDANIKTARWLEKRDLPITKETIEKYQLLEGFESALSKTALFDKVAEYIAKDLPLGSIELRDIISHTRLMAESQLRATLEAAARRQDIKIDTSHIRQTVRELVRLDEDFARSFLRIAGADDNDENVTSLRDVMDALEEIQPLTANVHTDVMRGEVKFNLAGIREAVTYAHAQYEAAVGEYERFATVPSSRYGDSIAPLKAGFADVLEANGIAVTEDNLRAAYILSRSRIDVTEENVQAVAEIDAKINYIAKNLHPMITAQLLKDGYRPLDMHADEMLSYIRQFNREQGEGGTDAIARHIMEMENENTLDADTREKMIAVYRMLHVIQKDGAAALGLAAKQETNLTLGGLMELAKYLRNTRKTPDASTVDASTEDGYLERLTRPAESIRRILDREPQPPPPRADLITEEFAKIAEPKRLLKWLINQDTPIEELTREAEIANPNGSLQTAEEQVHFFASTLPALIEYLQARNIPATGANLRALNKLAGRRNALADALDSTEDDEELPLTDTSLEGLLEGLLDGTVTQQEAPPKDNLVIEDGEEETDGTQSSPSIIRHDVPAMRLMTEAWAALDGKLPTPSVTSAKEVLALQHRLNRDDGFSIPIRVNGRASTLSLYVLNERALTEDGANVYMSLDTVNLGVVQGYFTVNGGGMDLRIAARDEDAAKALTAQLDMLNDALADSGITLTNAEIAIGGVKTEAPPPDMPVINPPEQGKARVPLSAYDFLV
jgi:hypothetical protein